MNSLLWLWRVSGRRLDEVDSTLWATKFTGQARPSCPRCGTHHSRNHCFQPLRGRGASLSGASFSGTPGFASGFTAQTTHVHDHYPQSRARPVSRNPASVAPATAEPCRKFNQGRCNFVGCRRPHVCTTCGASHPVFRCPEPVNVAGTSN